MNTPLAVDVRLLATAAFASAAGMRICDPMLPELSRGFAATLAQVAWVITAFSIAYGVLQFVYGPLGDRWDKRRLVALASGACALATLACAAAPALPWLVAARALAGATAAAIIPLSMAWIGDTVPYEARQPVLARFISGQILGLVAGQAVGGLLVDLAGWRVAFLALSVVFAFAAWRLHRGTRGTPWRAATPATGGVAAAFATSLRIAALPWARVVLAVVFVEGVALYAGFAFTAAHLHDALGLPLSVAGLLLAGFGAGGLLYTLNVRRMVDALGERGLALGGGVTMATAFALLHLTEKAPLAALAVVAAGLGFYMLHNTLQTHATQMAPQARGAAVALFASVFFAGQAVGVALAAPFVQAHGARPVFAACAGALALTGAAFALALARRART